MGVLRDRLFWSAALNIRLIKSFSESQQDNIRAANSAKAPHHLFLYFISMLIELLLPAPFEFIHQIVLFILLFASI